MACGTNTLQFFAEVTPTVFEQIALYCDRATIFRLLRSCKLIRARIQSTMNAKKQENRILPFRNTTVVINRNYWKLGFNTINFYGFTEKAQAEGKKDVVQIKKPFGTERLNEMKKEDVISSLKGFSPKKYVFDIINKPEVLENHLNVMARMGIALGTTTEVVLSAGHHIKNICAALKPKELILANPFIYEGEEYFAHESFQSVERLCIRTYRIRNGYEPSPFNFKLTPLCHQLVSFEFSGNIGDEYPVKDINVLLMNWVENMNPLRKIRIVTGKVEELVPVLDRALHRIFFTSVSQITQLPGFMQEKVLKDLVSLDWKESNIFYRLIHSPAKQQMGLIYYCNEIETPQINGKPTDNTSSYFGFYAFDYYPVPNRR